MAIAFLRAASAVDGTFPNPVSPVSVSITLNAGETGVLVFVSVGGTPSTVSSISGGGTWTQQVAVTTGTTRVELWATGVNAATSTSTVSVTHSAGGDSAVGAGVAAYSGVAAFGITATGGALSSNPTVSLTTTGFDSVVVGGLGADLSPFAVPTAGTGTLRHQQAFSSSTVKDLELAIVDNTATPLTALTTSVTLASSQWSAVALELQASTRVYYTADADV
jgi:hypothetical protein